jgi:hypothetical protein
MIIDKFTNGGDISFFSDSLIKILKETNISKPELKSLETISEMLNCISLPSDHYDRIISEFIDSPLLPGAWAPDLIWATAPLDAIAGIIGRAASIEQASKLFDIAEERIGNKNIDRLITALFWTDKKIPNKAFHNPKVVVEKLALIGNMRELYWVMHTLMKSGVRVRSVDFIARYDEIQKRNKDGIDSALHDYKVLEFLDNNGDGSEKDKLWNELLNNPIDNDISGNFSNSYLMSIAKRPDRNDLKKLDLYTNQLPNNHYPSDWNARQIAKIRFFKAIMLVNVAIISGAPGDIP